VSNLKLRLVHPSYMIPEYRGGLEGEGIYAFLGGK
jgi:hypothetical protein